MLNAKVLVGTWALGYDYLMFLSMTVVFLLALAFSYATKR